MRANFLNRNTKVRINIFCFCKRYSTKQTSTNQEYFKALEYIYDDKTLDNLSVVIPFPGREKQQETFFNISNTLTEIENSIVISDTSATNIGGARYGPSFIRRFSNHFQEKPTSINVDSFGDEMEEIKRFCLENKVIDKGSCILNLNCPTQGIKSQIIDFSTSILSHNNRMLSLGGDHYISYPLLAAHKIHYGHPITILHFDAHHDTVKEEDPNAINHATMFYHAMKDGTINIQNSIQVGIRERVDTEEVLICLGDEMKFISSDWIKTNGIKSTVETILSTLGNNPVYLTFDIDCLDPKIAPGTGTPIPKGMQIDEINQIFEGLKGKVNFIGADLVEYAPRYDKTCFKTLKVVMQLLHQLLNLLKSSSQVQVGKSHE